MLAQRVEQGSTRAVGVGPWSRWSTRQWLTVGVSSAMAVLLTLGAVGGWVLSRATSVTDTMVDRSSPALVQAVGLESALLDQETGIRGYGLSGQASFLQPYTEGVADEKAAVEKLTTLLVHDRQGRADLDAVLARVRTWQTAIALPIAAVPAGVHSTLATRTADVGKADFDAIRAAATVEQNHLQAESASSEAELRRTETLRNWVFTAIAVVILLLAVLVFLGLRRGITEPLDALSAGVRQVSDGDFEHRIDSASGPADLRALAGDVEAMRQRLAEELAFTRLARQRLDEQAADLRRSNGELEQFAYVASHDLQEPLRKVASFCQLLQRRYGEQLDARADQYIAFAVDGANRMQTLINDLLAFSRVGRMHNHYTQVDLEALLAATADALSIATDEAGARITHDPLPVIASDSTQMGMLLQNLLGNAIKFRSPERPPRIHLTARQEGPWWHFAVEDNGIGIDAEFADRVFVIFQRLHTKDAYPGNGIGLAMCKKIVEFHGGSIAVDPDHTPGTRITFSLPAVPSAPATDPQLPGPAKEPSPTALNPQ